MKQLTLALPGILLLALLLPMCGSSQTLKSTEENVAIELYNRSTKEYFTFYATMERIHITPSGNFLRTVSLKIDLSEPIMNFSMPRKIFEVKMQYDIDGDGAEEDIVDTMAVLTRSGNLTFVYHSNGAGNRLPRGWDF